MGCDDMETYMYEDDDPNEEVVIKGEPVTEEFEEEIIQDDDNENQEEVKSIKPTKIKISLKSQSVTSLSENTDDATNEDDVGQGKEVDIKTEVSEPNDTCDTIQIENTYSEQIKDELQDYDHHEESDFEVYNDLIREDDIKKEHSDH